MSEKNYYYTQRDRKRRRVLPVVVVHRSGRRGNEGVLRLPCIRSHLRAIDFNSNLNVNRHVYM